ncbi:crotonase/enoyl-CoA hydratase family protein [Sandarakinorhabdus rubra]|uniref:crotonase/enoyl-CoA hydratase family protein n=1 Tax=Sandarakinorhabdus rubra TaxID=2672568 RepID=UPI0013DD4C46|nr:crotonase/enoyl-CoA hydratase family protein [Sandarakinorhabdus rubra]
MELKTLDYAVADGIARITLNRPAELNTMNGDFWPEMVRVFHAIEHDMDVRCVIIASTGKHFTAGLDLNWAGQNAAASRGGDLGRQREAFRRHVKELQDSFNVIDNCRVPVIAVTQGGCIGGGVDLVTACDLRICTADAFFTIQEINVAIVADVGTLQRIPFLLPQGLVRELAYTGRRFPAAEAAKWGFVNRVEETHQAALDAAEAMAREICSKSPLAITGIKQVLNYGRDHSVADGLEYVAVWNAGMLQGEDMAEAVKAQMTKQTARFGNLKA